MYMVICFGSLFAFLQVAGSYVFTSGDLATSPMVRRVVENMMNATLRKLEVRPNPWGYHSDTMAPSPSPTIPTEPFLVFGLRLVLVLVHVALLRQRGT